jgi:hypothetical protein
MIFINKKILLSLVLVIFFLVGVQVFAANDNHGLDTTMKAVGDERITAALEDGGSGKPSVSKAIGQIIGGLLGLLGSIFFIMLVYGGFMWMTAQGNEQRVERAKAIITWAVWGVVIILIAYVMTSTIFSAIQP